LIEARAIGSVKVVAQAVGVEESSGNRIVYSEDTGEVSVILYFVISQPMRSYYFY